MGLVAQACQIIGWCVLSFLVGAGVGYLLCKDWLRWFADVALFLGLMALAWYFGIFTIIWHWERILVWLKELWMWLEKLYMIEGWMWLAKNVLYILCGLVGFIWSIQKFKLVA